MLMAMQAAAWCASQETGTLATVCMAQVGGAFCTKNVAVGTGLFFYLDQLESLSPCQETERTIGSPLREKPYISCDL